MRPRFCLDPRPNARRQRDLHNPGQDGAAGGGLGLPADMDDAPDRGGEFIAAGLASLGIEADETDLAVINGVHQVFGPAIRQLIEFDTSSVRPERSLDLSQTPPPEEEA